MQDCGGAGICEHNRDRSRCTDCGCASICQHNRPRSTCKDCRGSITAAGEEEEVHYVCLAHVANASRQEARESICPPSLFASLCLSLWLSLVPRGQGTCAGGDKGDSVGRYLENSVPQWGAGSSLAGQWLPAAGGDGAWAATTGSGPMRMCGDIFAAARLWRGRLLTTGHLSSRHPVVLGAGDVAWGSRRRGGRKRGRPPGAALPSACGVSTV